MKTQFRCLLVALLACYSVSRAQTITWSTKAEWISAGTGDSLSAACPVFQKQLSFSKKIVNAVLAITAHGLYEATLNGQRVGHAYFTPGYTSYNKRLQYQVYTITPLLKKGANMLQVTVAEGWYRGPFGGLMEKNIYGKDVSLLCQLVINYADGTTDTLGSNNSWQWGRGSIVYSGLYKGEMDDHRLSPGLWKPVVTADYGTQNLVPTINEPVVKQEHIANTKIIQASDGSCQIVDFGQNLAGWVRFKVKGKAGDTVKVYHAEVLDKNGVFYTGNLREAEALDQYILKGDGWELCEPHFTWHGFRYMKVSRLPGQQAADFTAVALYSDVPPAGTFACSDPMINRLQQNLLWSLKGNFFDIPSDCPQRSERLGWTADAHAFFRTAAFNRNVNTFFAKWLLDLKADQRSDGSVPNIIPNVYQNQTKLRKQGVAGWGDAAVIIPWQHFLVYGDTGILRNQYASMKAWVDYIQDNSSDGLWTVKGYGDWLAPGDSTSLPLIDQCFWAQSARLLAQTAVILNQPDDAGRYAAMEKAVTQALLQNYIDAEGKAVTHTQTAYVLLLAFDLLPQHLQQKAVEHLVTLIQENGNHLATGFLGTPYLLPVLSKFGRSDVAYTLLRQDTYPSWLYPVKMGATTIWERWDGIKPDSSVMATSYNHYSYGAVGDWLYRSIAGINEASPGYKKVIIRPQPGGGLTWASASYQCPHGTISSAWKIEVDKVLLQVQVPPGTSATVYVPGGEVAEVGAGQHTFTGLAPR